MWPVPDEVAKRFWEKIDWSQADADPDACWLWTAASRETDSIGVFGYDRKVMYAHRMSYLISRGQIPPGFEIRRSCFNSKCVRPLHLVLIPAGSWREEPTQRGRWLL